MAAVVVVVVDTVAVVLVVSDIALAAQVLKIARFDQIVAMYTLINIG